MTTREEKEKMKEYMLRIAAGILDKQGINYITINPLRGTPTKINNLLKYEFKFFSADTIFPKEQYINIYTLPEKEKLKRSKIVSGIDIDKGIVYEIFDKE
jgi:hypothetical protein